MVGLRICFNGTDTNILKKLLRGIDFNKYDFDINYFESYELNMPEDWDYLSDVDEITSEQAKNRILKVDEKCAAPEFLELFVRPKNTNRRDVVTYQEFLYSNYVMSIIIIDHRNIEICCKNENWLSKIYNNITFLKGVVDFQTVIMIEKITNEAILKCFRPKGTINIYDRK